MEYFAFTYLNTLPIVFKPISTLIEEYNVQL